MPISFGSADGVYDHSHTWQSANDRVAYERTVSRDPVEAAKIMHALVTADPSTPNLDITMNMESAPSVFAQHHDPATVMECFGRDLGSVNDFAPTNFSGQQGEFSGTSVPSLPPW